MVLDALVTALRAAFEAGPAMELVVLFGSRARGRARPDSDVDVGIVPVDRAMPLAEELALETRLSKAIGAEVSLVRLDGDDLLLGREVATHGLVVVEARPGRFARYRAEAIGAWLDFEESLGDARERWLRRIAERGTR